MSFRILVDCTFIVPGKNRGTQTYLDALLVEMNRSSQAQLVCLTTAANHSHYSDDLGLSCYLIRVGGTNRLIRVLAQQLFSWYFLRRSECDVLFCPGYLSPVFIKKPCVVTIHDMAYRDISYSISMLNRLLYRIVIPLSARQADKIIAVSNFSRSRILHWLNVPPESVHTVHEGPLHEIEFEEESWETLKHEYKLSEDVFLSVSQGLAHKNILLLIKAFLIFVRNTATFNCCLVLIGHNATDEMKTILEKSSDRDRVIFTGFVSDAVKRTFFKRSKLYVFPSHYEGFGLPVLEAQSCGLPLICSNAASLPEVAGEGALYFNPHSVDDLVLKLSEAYENNSIRDSLIEKGYRNAERFTWSRAAAETIDICHSALKLHSS